VIESRKRLALSDRMNTVLARDVQQMLNGRAFLSVLVLSLLAVGVLGGLVAGAPERETGRDAFLMVILTLTPVLSLVVPMQAFFSARHEVGGGASELLLLSNLTPARIVLGKLLSAGLQILLWSSVFAPVMAFTFLLRGISVVQIGAALLLAMVFGLTMSAAGIAFGALTVWRRVTQLVSALSLLVLAGGTFGFTSYLAFALSGFMGRSVLLQSFVWVTLVCALATILLVLVACSQFTHPYENRSTGFRCFLPLATLVGAGLVLALVDRNEWGDALPALASTALGCGIVFFVFAATEEPRLSPRVASQVPADRRRALLVAPLLPGHGRGLFCALLTVAILLGLAELGATLDPGLADPGLMRVTQLLALYALFYASIAASIRRRFPEGASRNWLARFLVLVIIVLGCSLPILFQGLIGVHGWTPLQILNPVWTIGDSQGSRTALPYLVGLTVLALLWQIGPMMRGLREVAEASRRRAGNADAR
jgi:hypothetical protein